MTSASVGGGDVLDATFGPAPPDQFVAVFGNEFMELDSRHGPHGTQGTSGGVFKTAHFPRLRFDRPAGGR